MSTIDSSPQQINDSTTPRQLFATQTVKSDDKKDQPLHKLLSVGSHILINSKTLVYKQAEPAQNLYVISKGLVKISTYLPNGKEKIVRICRSGSLFGLEATLHHEYEYYAYTISPTTLVAIPKHQIESLRNITPIHYCEILEKGLLSVLQDEKRNAEYTTGTVKARVARVLCYLATLQDEDEGITLICGEDMASLISATIESVSRVLAEFKRAGILTADYHNEQVRYQCDINTMQLLATDDKKARESLKSHKEQRKSRRGQANSPVDIVVANKRVCSGTLKNYSREGVFLALDQTIPVKNKIDLMIHLPDTHTNLLGKEIQGRIVRRTKQGIGVKIDQNHSAKSRL